MNPGHEQRHVRAERRNDRATLRRVLERAQALRAEHVGETGAGLEDLIDELEELMEGEQ